MHSRGRHRTQSEASGGPPPLSQADFVAVESEPSSQDTDRGEGRTRTSMRLAPLILSHPSGASGGSSPRRSPRKGKGKQVEIDSVVQEKIIQDESSSSPESAKDSTDTHSYYPDRATRYRIAKLFDHAKDATFEELAGRIETDGFLPLVDTAFKADEDVNHANTRGLSVEKMEILKSFRSHGALTLCTMGDDMVRELCAGNIARRYVQEKAKKTNFVFELDLNFEYSSEDEGHPSIYVRVLGDEEGNSPTANQMVEILKVFKQYVSKQPASREMLYALDKSIDEAWDKAWTAEGRTKVNCSPSSASTFTRALEKRLRKLDNLDAPLHPPLKYFGYSRNGLTRKLQHDRGWSSNQIMRLILVICKFLFPGKDWCMHNYTLCIIGEPAQAAHAEMLLTRIGNGYIQDGGGFNIQHAGITCNVDSIEPSEWIEIANWLVFRTDLKRTLQLEAARCREYQYRIREQLKQHHSQRIEKRHTAVEKLGRDVEVMKEIVSNRGDGFMADEVADLEETVSDLAGKLKQRWNRPSPEL